MNLASISGVPLSHGHPVIIVENITSHLPRVCISSEVKRKVKSFVLADPSFDIPGPIDVLLGADLFPLVFSGISCPLGKNMPVAMDTIFGFVLMGTTPVLSVNQGDANKCVSLIINACDINSAIKKFWEIEETPCLMPVVDKQCEEHFKSTHTREEKGRYVTRLPF